MSSVVLFEHHAQLVTVADFRKELLKEYIQNVKLRQKSSASKLSCNLRVADDQYAWICKKIGRERKERVNA